MRKILVVPLILLLCAFVLPSAFAGGDDDNKLVNYYTWTGNGGAVVAGSSEGRLLLDGGESESWSFTVAGVSGTVVNAYLYVPTFYYTGSPTPCSWVVNITDPTATTTTLATGTSTPYDQDGSYELFRFNETSLFNGLGANVNGGYTVTIKNTGSNAFYGYGGAAVVIVFSDTAKPTSYVWINDGCEWIYYNTTTTMFASQGQPNGGASASLHTIVGGGQSTATSSDDELYFDGNLIATDPFDGSTGVLFDVDSFNVLTYMGSGGHNATFNDQGDGYFIYSAVLVYTLSGEAPGVPEFSLPAFAMLSVAIVGLLIFRRFSIPTIPK